MRNLLALLGLITVNTALALPDLTVSISAPSSAVAGSDVGKNVTITVFNRSRLPVPGSGNNGYMVDLFITKGDFPSGFARYDDNYFDGVLLKGGRYSNTPDLTRGESTKLNSSAWLPSDIKPGDYRLCARVDPGGKVQESNESNNTACSVIAVTRLTLIQPQLEFKAVRLLDPSRLGELKIRERPPSIQLPDPVAPPRDTGQDATLSVLADGTIVITYPDGSARHLTPDGEVKMFTPEGLELSLHAMQVESDDMPELPTLPPEWAENLANQLLSIVTNMLTEAELAAYQQIEADKSIHELIDIRLRSIAFLTAQEL